MKRSPAHLLCLSVLLLLPLLSQAAVYKWVDDEGNVHFGDKPPAQRKTQSINIKPAPQVDPLYSERLRKQQNFLEQRQEDREERQAQETKQKQQEAAGQHKCLAAKQELQRLESKRRISVPQQDGSKYYMNNDERLAYLENLRRQIRMYCKE